MLSENIKAIRKSKGLSQQELAVKLHVVRQTLSKWEQGLSVPDSDALVLMSEALATPVSTLLGESVVEAEVDGLQAIAANWKSSICSSRGKKLPEERFCSGSVSRWALVRCCFLRPS